jgi:hypothetical protein
MEKSQLTFTHSIIFQRGRWLNHQADSLKNHVLVSSDVIGPQRSPELIITAALPGSLQNGRWKKQHLGPRYCDEHVPTGGHAADAEISGDRSVITYGF